MDRFDKFSDHARTALTLAQDEAQRFNHSSWGSETPIRARTTPARSADAIPPLPRRPRPRPSPRQRWTGWSSRPSRCPLRAGHDLAV